MAQLIINTGTVANDGTGDTIRGAFTNVNANFTEVYGNIANLTSAVAGIDLGQNTTIQASFNVANSAFAQANSANTVAYNVGISANLFSIDVGTAGNLYAVFVGTSSNSYAQSVGTAGNNYASILSANNAGAANAWANNLATSTYAWANSTFTTLSNTSLVFNTANASFAKANVALANTTGTFQGNLSVTGFVSAASFSDPFGSVRERVTLFVGSNTVANGPHLSYIANNSGAISIKIPDDNIFLSTPNVGTSIEVYQLGTGSTSIIANDAAVTIYSSNNWTSLSGQYLTASLFKIQPNTWILTGNLKA
jgi:hypothetical protein